MINKYWKISKKKKKIKKILKHGEKWKLHWKKKKSNSEKDWVFKFKKEFSPFSNNSKGSKA